MSIGLNMNEEYLEKNDKGWTSKLINFYTTHCPQCMVAEQTMNRKGIEFNSIDDPDTVLQVAGEHSITGAPFAEIDGEYLRFPDLMKFINAYNGGM